MKLVRFVWPAGGGRGAVSSAAKSLRHPAGDTSPGLIDATSCHVTGYCVVLRAVLVE